MRYQIISLKDHFSYLKEIHSDGSVAAYLQDNLSEMGREDMLRPCLIVCPGGGYQMCSQRESEPIALHFLPEGFQVFVISYSVSPHRYPTQLLEVAATLELIHKNAKAWHCDVSRIAIMGFSAGGHLAAHYSNCYNCPDVRTVFPESKPVQATLLCYPVITAEDAWSHKGSFDHLTGHMKRTPEENALFSCEKMVSSRTPPTFLWHTSPDPGVPVMNSLLYAQALTAHHIPFELHIYPQGGHGLSACDQQTLEQVLPEHEYVASWLPCARKWLRLLFSATP